MRDDRARDLSLADGDVRARRTSRPIGHASSLERLETSADAVTTRRRHAEHYLSLAEMAEWELRGPEQATWLNRLEAEHDNLRAALRWAAASGETTLALRLAGALWWFWYFRGYFAEGMQRLEQILAAGGDAPGAARARVLSGLGTLARQRCDFERAVGWNEAALALFRQVGDRWGIAWSLTTLGLVAKDLGDCQRAASLQEQSLVEFRSLGDDWGTAIALTNFGYALLHLGDYTRSAELSAEALALRRALGDVRGIAFALRNLAEVARRQGDDGRAATLHEESLALFRQLGEKRGIAMASEYLGDIALERGDGEQATTFYREGLALKWELGDRVGVAKCLVGLARVAVAERRPKGAARQFGAAQAARDAIGAPLSPAEQPVVQRALAVARAELGAKAFAAAWTEGATMPIERAVADALTAFAVGQSANLPERPAVDRRPAISKIDDRIATVGTPAQEQHLEAAAPARLTPRELDILRLVAEGLSNQEVAGRLVMSPHTVHRHLANILTRLDLPTRAAAAVYASRHGLL